MQYKEVFYIVAILSDIFTSLFYHIKKSLFLIRMLQKPNEDMNENIFLGALPKVLGAPRFVRRALRNFCTHSYPNYASVKCTSD